MLPLEKHQLSPPKKKILYFPKISQSRPPKKSQPLPKKSRSPPENFSTLPKKFLNLSRNKLDHLFQEKYQPRPP